MFFCFHLFGRDDTFNHAFFVDDESRTEYTHIFTSVHTFFSPYSELFYQLLVGIGNKSKGQLVLFNEFLMRFGIIHTDTLRIIEITVRRLSILQAAGQPCLAASLGILRSPLGETATDPTFGPSGRHFHTIPSSIHTPAGIHATGLMPVTRPGSSPLMRLHCSGSSS